MKTTKLGALLFSAAGMILLIMDSQTAASGARDGVELCLRTLIPSLFPFFVLSNLLTSTMLESNLPFLRPLGIMCRVSPGCESLLAVGFLGGYPVGAQNVALSFRSGKITSATTKRMMAFCNNAGPAFLFGVVGSMFSSRGVVWILWLIHIAGAVVTGFAIPPCVEVVSKPNHSQSTNLSRLMEQSVKTMANVCGWVILFRIILQFLDKWLFWRLSVPAQVLLSGLLELSNGCVLLTKIDNDGLRFLICSVILALGGLCVTMQTFSLCQGCDMTYYFPGKILQGLFSFLASYCTQLILFPDSCIRLSPVFMELSGIILLLIVSYLQKIKNISSNSAPVVV